MTTLESLVPVSGEDLVLVSKFNRFDEQYVSDHGPLIPVWVDGIKGKAGIGTFGAFSDRLKIVLEEAHPELGKEFQTKYFSFDQPGQVIWGHHGQSFQILRTANN